METTKPRTRLTGIAAAIVCASLALTLTACGASGASNAAASSTSASTTASAQAGNSAGSSSAELPTPTVSGTAPEKAGITVNDTISNSADGEHAIEADGTTDSYQNVAVQKTGDSDSGDEADFYGDNAAIFATNGATLNLSDIVVESDGKHANGVFSYGEGTTVNISGSVIETQGNCSGGLMTTGGGTMSAKNLRILTSGNSSAAIRSDRGGGAVNVTGGSKWVLTGDSYITSLTCDADSIDLNGHTLYVNGQAYEAGTAQAGTAIEVVFSESSGHGPGGEPPSGGAPSGGSTPPEKPSGSSSSSSR